ncbi:hypothetical protein Nepgr_023610 [Nepenthes gracilis]|uniref:RRM domain-containing protein n=1 Tax=Nepenthes gracilis TaxID=150966 RepID=A0AAD3T124_NEPGR|nr:hypothetical protein Nepgr_023610 [Nepenthes gracilis]
MLKLHGKNLTKNLVGQIEGERREEEEQVARCEAYIDGMEAKLQACQIPKSPYSQQNYCGCQHLLLEAFMADGTENDERVDLEDDNYMEEIDDDDVDPIEDEIEDGTGDEKAEEQYDDSRTERGKEKLSKVDQSFSANENVEDEEKHTDPMSETDRDKHAELLSRPPYGSEVFIGGLPKDTSEQDLRELCEPIGEIYEVRLMKNKDTNENKGYAFVAFTTVEDAQTAIEELKNKEFKGKSLRCSLSESKHRLFIGNIPKIWSEDQFKKIIQEAGPGAQNIDLKQDALNPGRNRGFAFIEYYNHACADYARQKMCTDNFKLDGNTPTVTWADPKSAPDHSAAASQVKALYIKNIPEGATPEQLKELFQCHGEVTKVVLPPAKGGQGKGNFGFIHFAERSSALKAVKDAVKYEIDGHVLEVTMAKPQTDKKTDTAAPFSAALNYFAPPAYGFARNPYGSMGAGYGVATGSQQPVIYGRGPMPAGMQMVPMVLPDGRIGYVLQQPGVQMPPMRPRRNDRSNGSGGSLGRGGTSSSSDDGSRSRSSAAGFLLHQLPQGHRPGDQSKLMGKRKEEGRDGVNGEKLRWKTFAACFFSFLVSMAGGVILVYWELDYHPTNSELWMVPCGLIMFATPVIIWFSSVVSDLCRPKDDDDDRIPHPATGQLAVLVPNSGEDRY